MNILNFRYRNTMILAALLLILCAGGSIYTFVFQGRIISEKQKRMELLESRNKALPELRRELEEMTLKAAGVFQLTSARKFIIPASLQQKEFFDFIYNNTQERSSYTFTNVEYTGKGSDGKACYLIYRVHGVESFSNLYNLISTIEHSRHLKKITSAEINNNVTVDRNGIPHYYVKFSLNVNVYYSEVGADPVSAFADYPKKHYSVTEAFYPLIRNEIPPNYDELPDIQNGVLLSLIPDGAFVADSRGETYLLAKGDPVYLGYLVDINYQSSTVTFILDKGGIKENYVLRLSQAKKN